MNIPKIIHIIWISPNTFPYEENLKNYKEKHPTWEIRFWTDENLPKLKNQKIYNKLNIYTVKADLLRLEILAKYGGVYVDADSVCIRPLDDLIENETCFFTTNHKGKIEINFMGCIVKDETISYLVENFHRYWRRLLKKGGKQDVYCVYRYIRRKLKKLKHSKIERQYNCTINEQTSETYIIQSMDHTWRRDKNND
jgi:mannosyltransferase OCH1-like enzyme